MLSHKPGKDSGEFFYHLSKWDKAPVAISIFKEVLARPIGLTQPGLQTRIYNGLVSFLLKKLEIPRSGGAREWEWRKLYQFDQEVNPQYLVEKDIHDLMDYWPSVPPDKRQIMINVLMGY